MLLKRSVSDLKRPTSVRKFKRRKVTGLALTTLQDWLKKLAPLFHPISPIQLIGSLCCFLCPLWLARVITGLVLREFFMTSWSHEHCWQAIRPPWYRYINTVCEPPKPLPILILCTQLHTCHTCLEESFLVAWQIELHTVQYLKAQNRAPSKTCESRGL